MVNDQILILEQQLSFNFFDLDKWKICVRLCIEEVMTIEEVEEIRKQELNDELRFPELQIERRQVNNVFLIQEFIYRAVNNKLAVSKMINRLRL